MALLLICLLVKGVVEVPSDGSVDEDTIPDDGCAGCRRAEVVDEGEEAFEVHCAPDDVVGVRTALVDAGIDYNSA